MSGRTKEETAGITHLGSQGTKYDFNYCPEVLETFINKHPDHDYFVKFNLSGVYKPLPDDRAAGFWQCYYFLCSI